MGKQGKLSDEEIKFVRARFFRYYSKNRIPGPPRLGLREWGFFLFGRDGMMRPVTFESERDIEKFLSLKVPRHAYYSSAYYRSPEKPMDSPEKGWMGADLIFDLDADGLPNAEKLSYEEQLSAVKEEIIRLYDIFLRKHLGFSDKEMLLVFSGGRGYHIHIRSPRVLDMDADERREIMDYAAGNFREFSDIFPKKRVPRTRSFSLAYMLPETEGGWGGFVRDVAAEILEKMKDMNEKDAVEFMKNSGIRADTAGKLWHSLFGERENYLRILQKGDIEVFRTESLRDNFIKLIEFHVRRKYDVHPDIHVTADTRRLIRLPHSLHGGTGFLVKPMSRDELDEFIPTRDAIPDEYENEKTKLLVENRVKIGIKGEKYDLKGEVAVPEYAAVFLLLSGKAGLKSDKRSS